VNRFEVSLYPRLADCPPERLSYRQACISIDGRKLTDLVRVAEEPWARAEYLERLSEFDDPGTFQFEPGDYKCLPASMVMLPSRSLLDQPHAPGFVLEPDDPSRGKATVLGCSCGIVECWFIQVRVQILPGLVIWSEFGQFHRPHWRYGIGPYTFDRRQYEEELGRID
jgi:hypothetical protein